MKQQMKSHQKKEPSKEEPSKEEVTSNEVTNEALHQTKRVMTQLQILTLILRY